MNNARVIIAGQSCKICRIGLFATNDGPRGVCDGVRRQSQIRRPLAPCRESVEVLIDCETK